MKHRIYRLIAALPLLLLPFASQTATAVGHPYDFAIDARMANHGDVTITKTYGYMTLVTDRNGNGIIDVMFSNGNARHSARFNARVKFLDAAGAVIREEYFNHWLAAAEFDEPIEGKVSKPLPLSDFDSIQVEFFLSDISGSTRAAANNSPGVRVSDALHDFGL
jgi:hypothetical protein